MDLKFNDLRAANLARLPAFTNKHGERCHKAANGSDWSPAQWLQALIGEVGEFAAVREKYEAGELNHAEYERQAKAELADIQGYLDLLSQRALDRVAQRGVFAKSPAQVLMSLIANLGTYANERKKFDRGDHRSISEMDNAAPEVLSDAMLDLQLLMKFSRKPRGQAGDDVSRTDPHGINLGRATVEKFNNVSRRVGSDVFLEE
jgi:hypothetical protein